MKIFQYVPERRGYIFKGWNAKKDGSENLKYICIGGSWRSSNDESSQFDKDGLIEGRNGLQILHCMQLGKDPNYSETRKLRLQAV